MPPPDSRIKLLKQAHFLTSAPVVKALPPDSGAEVAFAGRSNAGKSSALNTLTGQKSLARVSKTPGRTQAINFFAIDEEHRLVDLPGYGYAKVAKSIKQQWQQHLLRYIETRQCLQGLVLMSDIRHPLTDLDRQLLDLCMQSGLPVHILLTKADKLSRGRGLAVLQKVAATLAEFPLISAQLFSSHSRIGVDDAADTVIYWLGLGDTEKSGLNKEAETNNNGEE